MSEKNFFVFGLNHKTAPLEIRERTFISGSFIDRLVQTLKQGGIEEFVPLSTCNRTELYFLAEKEDSATQIKKIFSSLFQIEEGLLEIHTYLLKDKEAIEHLFRVSSGLDSMVFGEPQILGQVKDAYRLATELNTTGKTIDRIFHRAFHVAKRIRTETKIGYNPLSISTVAIELSKRIFFDLKEKKILLIGSGKMAKIALKHFLKEGVKDVYITNRTFQKARNLAEEITGNAYPFDELPSLLLEVDMVLTSTGSERYIIEKELVKESMKRRKGRPLFIIDIAVPRDVEPEVGKLENVYLYDIDDLKDLSEKHLKDRLKELEKAESIIKEETKKFLMWLLSFELSPLIKEIVEKAEEIRKKEVDKILSRLKETDEKNIEQIDILSRALVKKLLHPYIVLLKESKNPELAQILKRSFGIDEEIDHRDTGQ